jgi:hypothetical protein
VANRPKAPSASTRWFKWDRSNVYAGCDTEQGLYWCEDVDNPQHSFCEPLNPTTLDSLQADRHATESGSPPRWAGPKCWVELGQVGS